MNKYEAFLHIDVGLIGLSFPKADRDKILDYIKCIVNNLEEQEQFNTKEENHES